MNILLVNALGNNIKKKRIKFEENLMITFSVIIFEKMEKYEKKDLKNVILINRAKQLLPVLNKFLHCQILS